jgi:hypothetical protein
MGAQLLAVMEELQPLSVIQDADAALHLELSVDDLEDDALLFSLGPNRRRGRRDGPVPRRRSHRLDKILDASRELRASRSEKGLAIGHSEDRLRQPPRIAAMIAARPEPDVIGRAASHRHTGGPVLRQRAAIPTFDQVGERQLELVDSPMVMGYRQKN